MLNFNPQEIDQHLFPLLQKSSLHVNRVGVMLDATSNIDLLQSIPEEMLKDLPEEIREDIRLKRLGVRKDSGPVQEQESMIIIDCVRPDGNELQAVVKESGKIVLHFRKDQNSDKHYKSITNVQSMVEIPIILESDEFIEECKCHNNH